MDDGAPTSHPALHYMAMLKAARDFGLTSEEIEVLACRLDFRTSVDVLAERLADAVLARAELNRLLGAS
jgi:hypothetical protein